MKVERSEGREVSSERKKEKDSELADAVLSLLTSAHPFLFHFNGE
jgi:hypothetical protein